MFIFKGIVDWYKITKYKSFSNSAQKMIQIKVSLYKSFLKFI